VLIGLTYDLRSAYLAAGYGEEETAEFDRDDTVDALEAAIGELGHEVRRIGTAKELAAALVRGERWDLVFNIAEGLHGIGREAVVPALLELYGIPCTFSDPLVMALTLHKGLTKRVLRDAGLPTPDFLVYETAADLESLTFGPPWFAKPVAEGTGKGIDARSVIRDRSTLASTCAALVERYGQAALVEAFLPGREVTVAILGTGESARTAGTIEVVLLDEAEPDVYSYVNKERCEELVEYRLVDGRSDAMVAEAERLALAAWRVLGCRDAGRVDLRCDGRGRPYLLELNPLAGIHPAHSDLPIICTKRGVSYVELIRDILESAAARVPGAGAAS
jgi:D-alanine-D-alanine ligase